MKPEFFLVLPWHFRQSVLSRETDYAKAGGKFVFPMPAVSVV